MNAEDNGELPEGWASATLDDGLALSIQPGFACGGSNRVGAGIPHLRPMNVSVDGRIALDDVKFVPAAEADRDERRLRKGDVLFNNTNSPALVGKTAYYGEEQARAFSNHMTRVRTLPTVLDPQYCALVLHQRWREQYFEEVCNNHVGQSSISRSVLASTPLPLPPLAEQRRIVAAVEAVLTKVNAARARLNRVPAILKRFRQAVLSAACSGRLTADWRGKNPNVESAQRLLERISAERFTLWCEATRAKARSEARTLTGEAWQTRYSLPVALDAAERLDIPSDWEWASFDTFTANFQYGPRFGEEEYVADGFPTIRTSDMNHRGEIVLKSPPRVAIPEKSRDHFLLHHSDLVITRTGATIGKCALYSRDLGPAVASAYLIRYRITRETTVPEFLRTHLLSPFGQDALMGGATAVAQPNINTTTVSQIAVPLPPLAEQQEIVRRVDKLFALADVIEARLTDARRMCDQLTQAVLARAFRGELVPTEAALARREKRSYEHAADLLARIRAERHQPSPTRLKPDRTHSTAQTAGPNPARITKTTRLHRALALAYFTDRQPEPDLLNRTRAVKLAALVQWQFRTALALAPVRGEHGPYDKAIEAIEKDAEKAGFIEKYEKPKGGGKFAVRYRPGPKSAAACKKARALFGDSLPAVDEFLDRMFDLDTDAVELFGTVYAAWNELLLDNRQANDAAILAEVHGWHASKRDKFSKATVLAMLARIREWGYTPKGSGPRTLSISSTIDE